jgi:chromate transporter
MIAIFLPGTLLVLFFFPVWEHLKKYAVVYRSLEGILSAVIGLMIAAALYLSKDLFVTADFSLARVHFFVIITTIYLLTLTRVAAPLITLLCLFLGWWF